MRICFFKKTIYSESAIYILMAGILFHTATIITGFTKTGHLPVNNLRESLSLAAWAVAGMFLAIQYKYNLKILGIFAAPLVTLVMIVVSLLPRCTGSSL